MFSRFFVCLISGLLGLLFWGCSSFYTPDSVHQTQQTLRKPTQAHFTYAKNGTFTSKTFYDFPYPHDARLDADGSPALAAFPAPKRIQTCSPPPTNEPLINNLIKGIDPDEYITNIVDLTDKQTKGFSVNPSITFRFTRNIHSQSLPPLSSSFTAQSPIYLVNVTSTSKQYGRRIPIDIRSALKSRFLPDHTLTIRPHQGYVLQSNTTYAVVVHTDVRDEDGWSLAAHPRLKELFEAKSPTQSDEQKVHKAFQPLFDYFRKKQISIENIAVATVFTTGHPTQELKQLREFVRKSIPAPTGPTEIKCSGNSASTPYITCTGRFQSPAFQKGDAPYLSKETGFFTRDAQGKPVYTMEKLRFALTIPKRYLKRGALHSTALPIVLYAHGTGGNYRTFIGNGTARKLAQMGVAGFGIDQAVNGERTISLGNIKLDFLFFNALNLPAARDNVRQSALDYFWQTRFIHALKVEYKGQTFSFDKNKLWFMGHSQGGLIGPLILAFENDIRAAYLSAPGGLIAHTLLYKTQPTRPILLSAVLNYMLCEQSTSSPIDVFHPILGMVQHFFDSADPVSYSPLLLSDKRAPLNLLLTEGLTDGYSPTQVFEPLAIAMGLPLLGPEKQAIPGLKLLNIPTYALPIQGNYKHASGAVTTVGFTQHKECKRASGSTCDGHFVAFYNPNAIQNWTSFFQSMTYSSSARIH